MQFSASTMVAFVAAFASAAPARSSLHARNDKGDVKILNSCNTGTTDLHLSWTCITSDSKYTGGIYPLPAGQSVSGLTDWAKSPNCKVNVVSDSFEWVLDLTFFDTDGYSNGQISSTGKTPITSAVKQDGEAVRSWSTEKSVTWELCA